MQTITIQPVPSQTLSVVLAEQNVSIKLYQKKDCGVFIDVALNGSYVASGQIVRDIVPLIPSDYLGFVGNLMFIDTQGNLDPDYSGMGDRWQLIYLTADEYALIS